MKLDPKATLFGIWTVVSTAGTVISLASIADDIVAWSTVIQKLIASYREITSLIWGSFFSIFRIRLPQIAHDYLTINSLFAISLAWGLFNSSATLGFKLGSFLQFLKNNLAQFSVGESYFRNFSTNALSTFQAQQVSLTEPLEVAITKVSRKHSTNRLIAEGVLSIVSFLGLYLLFSFPVPALMRWFDIRHHRATLRVFVERRTELENLDIPPSERDLLLKVFDATCTTPARDEIQIIDLYHAQLRRSLLWYLLAVCALFLVVVFLNYIGRSIG